MVSHETLVNELAMVNNMSTEDRLNYAQKRRTEQIMQWNEYERRLASNNNRMTKDKLNDNSSKTVKFGDCITLLEAAARNDYEEVQVLLKHEVNPNEANEDGLTALHQACIDNFEDIVELLLENKADVNAVDSEMWTPLHAACTCGHTNIAEILVKHGADLLALNADHNMPYDISEEDDVLEFIEQAMAKHGITQEQINIARTAREKQIINDLKQILDNRGDITTRDSVGATTLHLAAANGYVDLTRFFLQRTTNMINAKDNDGWTPLHAAACWCQLEIVQILGIENSADPSIKNSLGELPVDVTEDEEIKVVLQKLLKSQKDRKNKLLRNFPKLNGRSTGSRQSNHRGQSFKGRSKRDKSKGISAVEAQSEAQYWTKGQETGTDIYSDESPNDDHGDLSPQARTSDERDSLKTITDSKPNSGQGEPLHSFSSTADQSDDSKKSKGWLKKKIFDKNYSTNKGPNNQQGETLSDLKQRRAESNRISAPPSPTTENIPEQSEKNPAELKATYNYLNGTSKRVRRKSNCVIL
ncbi:unnamed protein product [Clavelina lepadiformis]|uniref:Protein phosphatase 1 regulatory subunit 16A n=1 Tax=Clavelina lepadiformis TaxID=159417 RepID=A0ABP0GW51_CLALP